LQQGGIVTGIDSLESSTDHLAGPLQIKSKVAQKTCHPINYKRVFLACVRPAA
jgi:hypothetical protein